MADMDQEPEPTPYMNMNRVFSTRTVAEHATHLLPYLNKTDLTIVDVGCGVGSITLDLARRVANGHVVGMDVNHESISTAKAEAQAAGLTNIEFIVGDAADLSNFANDSFDIAHAHQVMLHLSEPVKALQEMRRIVKPGGVVAVRDNVCVCTLPNMPTFDRAIDIYQELSRQWGANPEGGKVNHVWMREAGFPVERIRLGSVGWGCSGEVGRGLWAGSAKGMGIITGRNAGKESAEFLDRYVLDWEEWEMKEEAKMMGLDGWVVATK